MIWDCWQMNFMRWLTLPVRLKGRENRWNGFPAVWETAGSGEQKIIAVNIISLILNQKMFQPRLFFASAPMFSGWNKAKPFRWSRALRPAERKHILSSPGFCRRGLIWVFTVRPEYFFRLSGRRSLPLYLLNG